MSKKKTVNNHCDECPSKGEGIFCELEKASLDEVNRQKITNVFKKGQTLFVEGTPPYGLYCVSEGNIKVTKSGVNGKDSIVRIAKAGDVIGHRSIFTDQFYSATATAMEDTKVCFIDKKYILNLVKREPSVACNLVSKLGRDLGLSEEKVASFTQQNVFERLAKVLLLLKESHGKNLTDGKILIDINLTRDELASMVGTATETVIRFVSELKEENVISQDGKKIIINNEEKLLNFANTDY
ncbi:MAG: Crp/Fnr family transcriptional regulator [Bdellovibrionales bacterium]|nr:Crp/Fnr family transcriptional regulator [Bdellovibrionales bacterium]